MAQIPCTAMFRVFQPNEGFRNRCPRVLVVCSGAHTHPMPLLSRAPPLVQQTISNILDNIKDELPDLTPRRFLRHPLLQSFLCSKFPSKTSPSLIDIHPSLANRDYVRMLIHNAKHQRFPKGTGWPGPSIFANLKIRAISDTELFQACFT